MPHHHVLENAGTVGRLLRLSLAAGPVSVPAARRFVADALSSWGRGDLLDDATLFVSELRATQRFTTKRELRESPLPVRVDLSFDESAGTEPQGCGGAPR